MEILGLENNYYLSGNDIWIQVHNFVKVPTKLEIQITNTNTSKMLGIFRLYPDPDNIFKFNISQIVRPLQPFPDHIDLNTLQNYTIDFTVIFEDATSDAISLEKYFIRGGREKNNTEEWYLTDGHKLVIDQWVDWRGIILPGYAKKIMSSLVVDYIPTIAETYKMNIPSNCNAKIIKFLNSLGGYQFWVFEAHEINPKVKGKKQINQTPMRLRDDTFRSIGSTVETEITLKTRTPIDLQNIIIDLINSPDILMYDPAGNDDKSKWIRLGITGSNDALINTIDRVYNNEITFNLPNIINRDL